MDDSMENNQIETTFNRIGNMPFPQASPSLKQREEQAFYEANSGDDYHVLERFNVVVRVINKLLKNKESRGKKGSC